MKNVNNRFRINEDLKKCCASFIGMTSSNRKLSLPFFSVKDSGRNIMTNTIDSKQTPAAKNMGME